MMQKRKFYRVVIPLALALLFLNQSFAQNPPSKFGKVTKEELEMDSYPADPEADALILFNYQEMHEGEIRRHVRIKILNKDGFNWANIGIFYSDDPRFRNEPTGIKAFTYNLDEDGKIEKTKLDKNDIYDEQLFDYNYRKRFTMPGIKEGSVFEYYYTKVGNFITLDWYFQSSIPTLWSECNLVFSDFYQYSTHFEGPVMLDVKDYSTIALTTATGYPYSAAVHKYVMKNVPALYDEPFVNNMNNHYAKLVITINKIHVHGYKVYYKLNTWEDLNYKMLDHTRLGYHLNGHLNIKAVSDEVVNETHTAKEKMIALYDYVKENYKWNGAYGVFTDENYSKSFKENSGNGTEVNLFLFHMLKKAGLVVYPVMLSTRSYKDININNPDPYQFNHIICLVKIGDEDYLLDATDLYRPYGLLAKNDLNERGWVLKKNASNSWIDLKNRIPTKSLSNCNITLNADCSFNGKIEMWDWGYNALDIREQIYATSENDYLNELISSHCPNTQVDSFSVTNLADMEKPISITMQITSEDFVQCFGNNLMVNPMLAFGMGENPLRTEERTFPVNFGYQMEDKHIINITIPEGYQVSELPVGCKILLPNEGGYFIYYTKVIGNIVQILSEYKINQVEFSAEEYNIIKDFYSAIHDKHSEPLILEK